MSSFDTKTTTNDFIAEYEMFAVDCDRIAVQSFPAYYDNSDSLEEALFYAQASYESCTGNGGNGLGWTYALGIIKHTYPSLFR